LPFLVANFAIFGGSQQKWQPALVAATTFFCVGNLQWRLPFLLAAFFGGVPKMEACQLCFKLLQ
jgi:hypothetical protein